MNPFTLKELRQLTRSKVIAGGLILALFLFLLMTYLIPLNGIEHNTGENVATVILMMLSVAFSIGLPLDMFVRMVKERRVRNADLTLITPLSPASIVDGKLCGAYALMFLFSAATLPFGVAAYMLHGVSFAAMFMMLVSVVAEACLVVHATIAIGALRCSTVFRVIAFGAMMFVIGIYNLVAVTYFLPEAGGYPWKGFVVGIACVATICMVLRAQAIVWMSPKVMERDARLRIVALVAAIGWIGYKLVCHWDNPNILEASAGFVSAIFSALAVWIAVNAMAQGSGYSQRQLAALPASRWRRASTWLFRSGTINGVAFALIFGMLAAHVIPLIAPHINALYQAEAVSFDAVAACCPNGCPSGLKTVSCPGTLVIIFAYIMAILMCFRAGWYLLFRKTNVSPVLAPILALMCFGLLQTIPAFIELSCGGGSVDFLPFCLNSTDEWADGYWRHALSSAIALIVGLIAMLPETIAAFRARR